MKNKPIIRHCKNCDYCCKFNHPCDNIYCSVRYNCVSNGIQRIRALFCSYYKKIKGADNK